MYDNANYLILKDFLTFCLVPVLSADPSRLHALVLTKNELNMFIFYSHYLHKQAYSLYINTITIVYHSILIKLNSSIVNSDFLSTFTCKHYKTSYTGFNYFQYTSLL